MTAFAGCSEEGESSDLNIYSEASYDNESKFVPSEESKGDEVSEDALTGEFVVKDKKYTFEVAINANKTEIKLAIEEIFEGVKVESVNTMRTLGKMKRQGRTQGRTPEVKKAIVTLKKDSKNIPFFEGMAEEEEA